MKDNLLSRLLARQSPARRWLVPGLFGLLLGLGLAIYRDYGLSVDENQQRDTGMVSLKHVGLWLAPAWVQADEDFERYGTPLAEYPDRDYGVAFETPVCLAERLLGYERVGDKFRFRHLCTFLVCFGGLLAVYQLAARRFADWRLGLLAVGWLVLSPRIFAELFYNDKDAVFMAAFAIATNTAVRLLRRPTAGRALWHALACGLTIDVRIMGVLVPVATLALLLGQALKGELSGRRLAGISALYLGALMGVVVAFWPYLWAAPLANFLTAFQNMSTFRWGGVVLYRGTMELATNLPWHYALVWMGITTPLLYLGTGLLGIYLVLRQMWRRRWRLWATADEQQDVLFAGLLLAPLLAVFVLNSTLYDGWRQLYFVYPALLLLAVRGWVAVASWASRQIGIQPRTASSRASLTWAALTAASAVVVAAQMVRDHPLQNVYFNLLAGSDVGQRYELDYWGLGFRQDLEYIVAHDWRSPIVVATPPQTSAEFNRALLPDWTAGRLKFTNDPAQADYFISNYRWHPGPYPYPEIYELRADGRRVHSVFRLR